jgi:hypothetical protein
MPDRHAVVDVAVPGLGAEEQFWHQRDFGERVD